MTEPESFPKVLAYFNQFQDSKPVPAKETGRLLFVDSVRNHYWISLPEESLIEKGFNWVCLRPGDSSEVGLGDLTEGNSDGCLAFLTPEAKDIPKLNKLIPQFSSFASAPASRLPDGIDMAQSLELYLHSKNPNPEVLRSIAWYASSRITDNQHNCLSNTLAVWTFEDLSSSHPAYSKDPIKRDDALLRELKESLKRCCIVFLSGGAKSGLQTFLEQFQSGHVREDYSPLEVNFSETAFREIYDMLTETTVFKDIFDFERGNGKAEIAGLLISLAYEAYTNLLADPKTDRAKLAKFVPPQAETSKGAFTFKYVTYLKEHLDDHPNPSGDPGTCGSPIEPFLGFVAALLRHSNPSQSFTVFLSFPDLMTWLRKERGQPVANCVINFLWSQLGAFMSANFDASSGELLADSSIRKYAGTVSILIETHWLGLPNASNRFCSQSVLTMPPFSPNELSTLWLQRTGTPAEGDRLLRIMDTVGGAPTFVHLLLECFQCYGDEASLDTRLGNAITLAREIIRPETIEQNVGVPRVQDAKEPEVKRIRYEWKRYTRDLKRRFSEDSLHNTELVDGFRKAVQVNVQMSKTSQEEEWLESGLIWLKHQRLAHTLHALDRFPKVRTYPFPELVSLFIDNLQEEIGH